MKVNGQTKISELIKFNPKSTDAIAALAKPFEKLKNPILRKIMASRVTVEEAARMGGVSVEDFRRVLKPLGFAFEEVQDSQGNFSRETKPLWLVKAAKQDIDFYDVRSIIENGADPLKEILHRFKEIQDGKILCIVNTFVPTPLINLLKQEKAQESFVEKTAEKEFYTYFLKKNAKKTSKPEEKVIMENAESFAEVCARFSPQQIHTTDVRALEMPGPMEAILGELQTLKKGEALFVHHKRVPVYLLEELAAQNFRIHIFNREEGDVKVFIYQA